MTMLQRTCGNCGPTPAHDAIDFSQDGAIDHGDVEAFILQASNGGPDSVDTLLALQRRGVEVTPQDLRDFVEGGGRITAEDLQSFIDGGMEFSYQDLGAFMDMGVIRPFGIGGGTPANHLLAAEQGVVRPVERPSLPTAWLRDGLTT